MAQHICVYASSLLVGLHDIEHEPWANMYSITTNTQTYSYCICVWRWYANGFYQLSCQQTQSTDKSSVWTVITFSTMFLWKLIDIMVPGDGRSKFNRHSIRLITLYCRWYSFSTFSHAVQRIWAALRTTGAQMQSENHKNPSNHKFIIYVLSNWNDLHSESLSYAVRKMDNHCEMRMRDLRRMQAMQTKNRRKKKTKRNEIVNKNK